MAKAGPKFPSRDGSETRASEDFFGTLPGVDSGAVEQGEEASSSSPALETLSGECFIIYELHRGLLSTKADLIAHADHKVRVYLPLKSNSFDVVAWQSTALYIFSFRPFVPFCPPQMSCVPSTMMIIK